MEEEILEKVDKEQVEQPQELQQQVIETNRNVATARRNRRK